MGYMKDIGLRLSPSYACYQHTSASRGSDTVQRRNLVPKCRVVKWTNYGPFCRQLGFPRIRTEEMPVTRLTQERRLVVRMKALKFHIEMLHGATRFSRWWNYFVRIVAGSRKIKLQGHQNILILSLDTHGHEEPAFTLSSHPYSAMQLTLVAIVCVCVCVYVHWRPTFRV